MKIQNLELNNFRNHEKTFIQFDTLNFILGKNNSGKSSIKGALQLALTGENEWVVAGKNKELIRHGQTESTVEVEIENVGMVKRIIKEKGNVVEMNGSKLPDKEVEKTLLDEFNLTYDALSCVITSSKFFNMKANDQKDFLFRLTNVGLDPQLIISYMENPTDEAKNIVLSQLSGQITIEVLDKLYNDFFNTRKAEKKNRDTLKANLAALGTVPATSTIDPNDVDTKLASLKKKRDGVLSKLAIIDEKAKQKARLSSDIAKLDQVIADLEQKVDKNINIDEAEGDIFECVTDISEIEKKIEGFKATYNTLNGQNKSLRDMLSKLNTKGCPLSDKLVCNTDKSFLTGELQTQIDGNDQQMTAAKSEWDKLAVELSAIKIKKENLEKQVALFVELEKQKAKRNDTMKELLAIVVEDKTALVAEIADYDNGIQGYNDAKNDYLKWSQAKTSYDKLVADLNAAEASVALYEYLVKEFSPNGVKARVLQKIISPIENYCNANLGKLTKDVYKLTFSFDDGFNILVTNASGIINLNSLSNSEKLRIGIIIQDAINNLTNAKVLFIDDAEILDQENTQLLVDLLAGIKDNYDSIFVIATSDDYSVAPTLKAIQGTKVFSVEAGAVSEL